MAEEEISDINTDIRDLEAKLESAKARLKQRQQSDGGLLLKNGTEISCINIESSPASASSLHNLFLLADSALPLGSFAFSSGLESFLAHRPKHTHTANTFNCFLTLSLASYSHLTAPFVIAGFENPADLEDLDNDLDASTACVVAKRASIKQGRALMGVWERSFRHNVTAGGHDSSAADIARSALDDFARALKAQPSGATTNFNDFALHGHLPPLFGTICAALSVPLMHTLYVYLLNHAKTLISAAIRASVVGPYQAQGILASETLRKRIWSLVEHELGHDGLKARRGTQDAGQTVPMLDIWGGRHEIVYSRIFNS